MEGVDSQETLDPESTNGAVDSSGALHDSPHDHGDAPDSPSSPVEGEPSQSTQNQGEKSNAPMQKRRRVTRACDECRRKKIKCDGKQPCTHCTVYSYECSYDQPSNRRRNAAPQYTEALEARLKRAESILRALMPHVDPNDPRLDAALQQGTFPNLATHQGQSSRQGPSSTSVEDSIGPDDKSASSQIGANGQVDTQLESMVRSTGQLDLDEQGNWDYHGHSSGFSFIKRMKEQFGNVIVTPNSILPDPRPRPMSQVFDSPMSAGESPIVDTGYPGADLPPKELARALCELAILDATALLPVLHRPRFLRRFENLYSKQPEDYGNEEHKFLPLLYAVLALGTLFHKETPYDNAIDEGLKYFRMSRHLLDIADCRHLTSLQALIYMIFFLQCSAKLSTCYSFVGVALRSALRMGLHRSFKCNFNPIEREERKRAFWVIRKMDTYVGALLGLPHSLQDEDIDQDLPLEVDDEYITETEILPMPEDEVSVNAAGNAHTTLNFILAKVVRVIYPIKGHSGKVDSSMPTTYTVSYAKIREIEKDLQEWMDKLPMKLRPGGEARPMIVRVRHLLRMSYAHTQMMLYRPFLHYIGNQSRQTVKCTDKRAFACAAACISVSRNIVHITGEMKRRGLLIGAYWFTMYTTFFAILSLVYFYLDNLDNPASHDVLRDAQEGRETLEQVAKRSMAADRCSVVLGNIFEQLPKRSARSLTTGSHDTRKRRQERSPHPLAGELSALGRIPSHETDPPKHPRRAATLPDNLASDDLDLANKRASVAFPVGPSSTDSPYSSLFPPSISNLDGFKFDSTSSLPPSNAMSPGGLTNASTPSIGTFNGGTPQQANSNFTDTPPNGVNSFSNNGLGDMSAYQPPITDLSAMMFPSADPFAYPNQPMTTFENAQGLSNDGKSSRPGNGSRSKAHSRNVSAVQPLFGNQYGVESPGASSRPGSSSFFAQPGSNSNTPTSPDGGNGLDAQLFGPMPMYMMATNNAAPSSGFGGVSGDGNDFIGAGNASAFGFGLPGGGFGAGDGNNMGGMQQMPGGQGNIAGLEDLFAGEEWAGMFDQSGATQGQNQGQGGGSGGGMGGFGYMGQRA